MRFSLFLIIFLFIFSCKKTPELKIEIKINNSHLTAKNNDYLKYYHPDKIGQEIEIQFTKNNKNKNNYGIMSCSYDQNFIIDNKDFKFQIINCDSNYPSLIEFKKSKSAKYKLLVTKYPKSKSQHYKIGYKKIIVPNDFSIIDSYNEQFENKKYEILWSEPIKFE